MSDNLVCQNLKPIKLDLGAFNIDLRGPQRRLLFKLFLHPWMDSSVRSSAAGTKRLRSAVDSIDTQAHSTGAAAEDYGLGIHFCYLMLLLTATQIRPRMMATLVLPCHLMYTERNGGCSLTKNYISLPFPHLNAILNH